MFEPKVFQKKLRHTGINKRQIWPLDTLKERTQHTCSNVYVWYTAFIYIIKSIQMKISQEDKHTEWVHIKYVSVCLCLRSFRMHTAQLMRNIDSDNKCCLLFFIVFSHCHLLCLNGRCVYARSNGSISIPDNFQQFIVDENKHALLWSTLLVALHFRCFFLRKSSDNNKSNKIINAFYEKQTESIDASWCVLTHASYCIPLEFTMIKWNEAIGSCA